MHSLTRPLIATLLCTLASPAPAEAPAGGFEVDRVNERVFALVGPLGNRTAENLGNNATYGVVVTSEGVVLIDSGGSYLGAQRIDETVRALTGEPVKVVVNTNAQDHRWLGNDYFRRQGARILAHTGTVEDQKARLGDMLSRLAQTVGAEGMAGTEAAYADELFDDRYELVLGDTRLELHPAGQAHTRSDIFVWLPRDGVLFSGDIVYVERMLSIRPYSNSAAWMEAFDAMAAVAPDHIVPGHGHVTTLDGARRDTYDYLAFLRASVGELMEAGGDMADIGRIDQSRFAHLANYEFLKGLNAQQVYQELEWE